MSEPLHFQLYSRRTVGLETVKRNIIVIGASTGGVKALKELPDCGLAAGQVKLFFKNPERPTATEIYESIHAFDQENMVKKYRHGATANLFTYRRVMDDVGIFNRELKSGGDVEWGKRVYAAGYKQVYAEDARVLHPARYSL